MVVVATMGGEQWASIQASGGSLTPIMQSYTMLQQHGDVDKVLTMDLKPEHNYLHLLTCEETNHDSDTVAPLALQVSPPRGH
eukprot:COSAG01_NODE_32_length_35644_cov_22.273738_25_plen_82_part_00